MEDTSGKPKLKPGTDEPKTPPAPTVAERVKTAKDAQKASMEHLRKRHNTSRPR